MSPEGWSWVTDVRLDACTGCGACIGTCPEHALVPAARRPLVVRSRCSGCLACVEICPRDALVVCAAPLRGSYAAPR